MTERLIKLKTNVSLHLRKPSLGNLSQFIDLLHNIAQEGEDFEKKMDEIILSPEIWERFEQSAESELGDLLIEIYKFAHTNNIDLNLILTLKLRRDEALKKMGSENS